LPRIERITAENYRGASAPVTIEFAKDKAVALIFGENGTGKTTIVDALDAAGNCSKGSLAAKSSTRVRAHVPTIGKKAADIRLEVSAGGTTWTVALAGDDIRSTPEPRPRIRVLRRADIQQLIDSQPKDRYAALRHLLDVNKVQQSEDVLRDAATSAKRQFDEAVKTRADLEDQLDKVWAAESCPGASAAEWAAGVAQQSTEQLTGAARRLIALVERIDEADRTLSAVQRADGELSDRQADLQQAEQGVANLPGADAEQTMSLAAILNQVQEHLAIGAHPDTCPVCLQSIDLGTLRADIDRRLVDLRAYERARETRESATRVLRTAADSVEARRNSLITTARALLVHATDGDPALLPVDARAYPALGQEPAEVGRAADEARRLIEACSAQKQSLTTRENELTRQTGQIAAVSELSARLGGAVGATVGLERIHGALHDAYEIVRLARIEFTQRILNDVADECNRLLKVIHPGESIALSKLELDEAQRASLKQSASFEGFDNVPPQAYFSESHLDTLGFCFWLAAAKRESPNKDAVIVLDDVFTSVDSGHLGRVTQLIADESSNFAHTIVTTHQRLWRDIYRNPHGPGKGTDLIELQGWGLARGISVYKNTLAVTDLAEAVAAAPFNRRDAANQAGILLEAILDNLALRYRCRVPRTAYNEYTLNELLDGTATLFKALEVQRPVLDGSGTPLSPPQYQGSKPKPILDRLRENQFVRNQVGAHYNSDGLAIADSDVQEFASLTVELARALGCDACGEIPSRDTGTHFQCRCPAPSEVRLLPLRV
jgi:energy-coupling factor transporter ATP-binding protein EcfA2